MSPVHVSTDFGIVIRRAALDEHGIDMPALLKVMETGEPFDQDNQLVSFGPHFGGEAAREFMKRLEALGLEYAKDFDDFGIIVPDWVDLYVGLKA